MNCPEIHWICMSCGEIVYRAFRWEKEYCPRCAWIRPGTNMISNEEFTTHLRKVAKTF